MHSVINNVQHLISFPFYDMIFSSPCPAHTPSVSLSPSLALSLSAQLPSSSSLPSSLQPQRAQIDRMESVIKFQIVFFFRALSALQAQSWWVGRKKGRGKSGEAFNFMISDFDCAAFVCTI